MKSSKSVASLNLSGLKPQKGAMSKDLAENKKIRLEHLLKQQFIAKYGDRQEHSRINNAIKSAVHNFVQSAANLDALSQAATSGELEAIVRAVVSKARPSLNKAISYHEVPEEKPRSRQMDANMKNSLKLDLDKKPEPKLSQYAILAAMEREEEEQKRNKEVIARLQKVSQFRSQLDDQLHELEARADRERGEKSKLLQQSTK